MTLTFEAVNEERPGAKWRNLFLRLWPGYRDWYVGEGLDLRPDRAACAAALNRHMPQMADTYQRLCRLADNGDVACRFLSLYRPPGYLGACSQAVWTGAGESCLVRNYDYSPHIFDALMLRTRWNERAVMGMSDCLIGLLDGMNEAGLVVSLTSGGADSTGDGFGIPIILRYLLETCDSVDQAVAALKRLPCHMRYNVTLLDAADAFATVQLAPGAATTVTGRAHATNHQDAYPDRARRVIPTSRAREYAIKLALRREEMDADRLMGLFLREPLYSHAFAEGFGTLYSAAYFPKQRIVRLFWPNRSWTLELDSFEDGAMQVKYRARRQQTA